MNISELLDEILVFIFLKFDSIQTLSAASRVCLRWEKIAAIPEIRKKFISSWDSRLYDFVHGGKYPYKILSSSAVRNLQFAGGLLFACEPGNSTIRVFHQTFLVDEFDFGSEGQAGSISFCIGPGPTIFVGSSASSEIHTFVQSSIAGKFRRKKILRGTIGETIHSLYFDNITLSLFAGSSRANILKWAADSTLSPTVFRGHEAPVLAMVSSESVFASSGIDKTIRVWNLDSMNNSNSIVLHHGISHLFRGHTCTVDALAINPTNQKHLYSGSRGDRTIRMWSLVTLTLIRIIENYHGSLVFGPSDSLFWVANCTANSTIKLLSASNQYKELHTNRPFDEDNRMGHIYTLVFGTDMVGNTILHAGAQFGNIRIF